MRKLALVLGACSLGALFACSDSDPAAIIGTGAEIDVLTVNGAPAASAPVVVDSVYVTAEIRLEAGAPAVTSAVLVMAGESAVLGTANVSVAPGGAANVTVVSHLVPSGTQTLFVRARSADGSTVVASAPATVTVTRPRTYLHVVSVNGAPPPAGGGPAAVADSFLVDVLLVVADTGSVVDRIALRRDDVEYATSILNTSLTQRRAGQTHRIPFAAWIAVPGRYGVVMEADHFVRNGESIVRIETAATIGPIPVLVTNSDVTPPVIRAPANEIVVSNLNAIPFEASDARGIWQYSLEQPGACGSYAFLGTASPATTGTVSTTAFLCLAPGRNRVIRRAIDTAGNVTTDEVTLIYPAAAASRSAGPRRTIVRQHPDGTVERVTGP